MKRFCDLAVVILFAPLLLTAVGAVAAVSLAVEGRPIFFRQRRAGKFGREFELIKFRTMREGEGDDGERLTRYGAFLRKTSLDELPEFWNILKGEMSLVGPRPLPIRYLPRYTREQNRRHEVLPGLTGWAQVNGRNALDWETKFRYDVEYVDRQSLAFDLKIVILTVREVLFPKHIAHEGEATMSEFTGTERKG